MCQLLLYTTMNWGWCDMWKIKTNQAAWKAAVQAGAEEAVEALANQMMNDSLQYIPKNRSILRDSGSIKKEKKGVRFLVWRTVYALYQWYGVRTDGTHRVKKYTTRGTGTQWVEKAKAKRLSAWTKVVKNAFAKGMK